MQNKVICPILLLLLVFTSSLQGGCDAIGPLKSVAKPGFFWFQGDVNGQRYWAGFSKEMNFNRFDYEFVGRNRTVVDLTTQKITYLGKDIELHGVSCRTAPEVCRGIVSQIVKDLDELKSYLPNDIALQGPRKAAIERAKLALYQMTETRFRY